MKHLMGMIAACVAIAWPAAAPVPPPTFAPPVLPLVDVGDASWYGDAHRGRRTASGEPFEPRDLTCAHRWLPFGALVRVTLDTGYDVVLRVTDRGPAAWTGRTIDISEAAAHAIGMRSRGVAPCQVHLLELP